MEEGDEDVTAVFVAVWCSNAVPLSRTWIYGVECYPALLAARTELTWVAVCFVPVASMGGGGRGPLGAGATVVQGYTSRVRVEKCSAAPPLYRELLYIFTRLPLSATDPAPVAQHAQLPWWTRARTDRPCSTCPFQAQAPCCGGTSRLQPCQPVSHHP